MNAKQIQAVIALPGPKRYEHFVKVVADRREVWGLFNEGWALAGTSDGQQVFPFWPAREYAEICAEGLWDGFAPREIDLDGFLDVFVPNLAQEKTAIGV